MAENNPQTSALQAGLPSIGPARHLRTMRVESQYRHDTRTISRLVQEKYGNLFWILLRFNIGPSATICDLDGQNN